MDRGYFITGTDTECGKTVITLGLMRVLQSAGLSVNGMKPVAAGAVRTAAGLINEDAQRIQRQCSIQMEYGLINPYIFEPPIAPHLAARGSGVRIDIRVIVDCYLKLAQSVDRVLVEGVGGWMVLLGDSTLLPDLALALDLPVIIVVGMRLGCINHSLLTLNAINASGCRLAGWVANSVDPQMAEFDGNLQTLQQRIEAPLLGVVPFLQSTDSASVARYLRLP